MRARGLGIALALAFVYGCGGSAKAPAKDASNAKPAEVPREANGPSFLPAHALVDVPEGSFGPYVGRSGDRGLLLYAQPTERGHRFVTLPLDAKGAKAGPAHDAGPAPDLPPRLVVRPMGDGFVAAFTYSLDLSSVISTLVFSPSGEPKGEATIVTHRADRVLYVDVVTLDGGAVLLYGAQRGQVAELVAIPIDEHGRSRGTATVLAKDALAWQVVSMGERGALALVTEADDAASRAGARGQVALVRFDREGRPVGERLVVSPSPTAEADIDATRLGDRLLLAWTDERRADAQAHLAVVGPSGQLEVEPRALTAPRGDQALLGLVAPVEGSGSALVAWEELGQETTGPELPAHARSVRIGLVGADGVMKPRTATLALGASEGAPELTASKNGWVALTLAPACARQAPCTDAAPLVPTVVHFDRDLAVLGSEPLATEAFGPAALAWGLSCSPKGGCSTLAASTSTPTPVASLELSPRRTGYLPAGKMDRTPRPPRAVTWETVATSDPIADLASTDVGSGTLVAWVTHFAEEGAALDAKGSPKTAAKVSVLAFDERGEALADPNVVSLRAASVGGVALATGSRNDDALLAWVGHDAGQTQVFATRLGKDGKKLAQQMVTRSKGGVSDVAVTKVDDGWLLAWVDGRDGNGEVYLTKLDRSLNRTLPERRITNTPGDASQVQLLVRDDEAWVGWMETREGSAAADPHAVRLSLRDLKPKADEVRLAATGSRSRGLQLAPMADGIAVGWIDEPVDAAQGEASSAKLLRLDANGMPLGLPVALPLQAPPVSLALSCEANRCRGLAPSSTASGGLRVDALAWTGGQAVPSPTQIFAQNGSSPAIVAPSFSKDWAFVAADDWSGQGRLRRMRVVWD